MLGVLHGAAADTYAAVAADAGCKDQVGCAGYYRAFTFTTSPAGSTFGPPSTVTGFSAAAIGEEAAGTSAGGEVKVDVAGFRFKNPADTSDANPSLAFYFGYLGVDGTWDTSTQTKNVAGALAEVIASIVSVDVYYDHDGVPGFQWDISQTDPKLKFDIYDCTDAATGKYDCVDPNGKLNVATDLQWTPISSSVVACNTQPGLTSYAAGCEIHSLNTVGSLPSAPTTAVLNFTIRIASQPVLINGVKHGPDFAKWDLAINFPYSNYQLLDATNAKLAVVTAAAGKAGAFTGSSVRSNGVDTLNFQVAGVKARSYYSYSASASINGNTGTIYTQVISGAQIQAYTCTTPSPCAGLLGISGTNVLAAYLAVAVNAWGLLGWKTSIAIHAVGDVNAPASVVWDPTVGAGSANSALLALPSTLLLAILALLLL